LACRIDDPWGNPILRKSTSGYAFTGREWDPETNLYYYRARYYDPKIGRFLSEDPEGFIDGPNMYTYVLNNPARYVDPWGLASCECPTKQKNCLELLFNQPVGNVQIVTKGPNKKWKATTRKNTIIVYGECDDFFEDSSTVLEEYYHVMEQWKNKRFFKIRYGIQYALPGYDNKYEKEAWKWVDANLQAYLDCLARQD
jgi:RHS repeat-associated protein